MSIPGLQPWLQVPADYLLRYGAGLDRSLQVTSTYRSLSTQRRLYQRYLSGLSKYPAAPPGRSYHNYGRAMDVVASAGTLSAMGSLWRQMGGRWYPSDPIHFEA